MMRLSSPIFLFLAVLSSVAVAFQPTRSQFPQPITFISALNNPHDSVDSVPAAVSDIGIPFATKQLACLLLGVSLLTSVSPNAVIAATSAATSQVTAVSKSPTTGKLKLVEEIAYEGAVEKRNANKARQQTLKVEIKDAKSKLSLLNNELKRLDSQLLGIERKLDSKNLPSLDAVKKEQEAAIKKLGEKRVEIGAQTRKIERDSLELQSLEKRFSSDESFIKVKQEEMKKKFESIKKDEARAKFKQLEKEANEAKKVEKKIADEVAKDAIDIKSAKRTLENFSKSQSKAAEVEKAALKKTTELEKALASAKVSLEDAKSKVTAEGVKVSEYKAKLAAAEARLKGDESALKTAQFKYQEAAKKVKK